MVEQVKLTFRNHPITAWAFLIGAALVGLLVITNQVLAFLKNIGAMN